MTEITTSAKMNISTPIPTQTTTAHHHTKLSANPHCKQQNKQHINSRRTSPTARRQKLYTILWHKYRIALRRRDNIAIRRGYRILRVLTLTLGLGLSLAACRATKQSEHYTAQIRRDSLSLWQWDDLVLVHERLDSTGTRPTERSTLRWHKTQHLAQQQRQDSLHHSHTTSKPRTIAPRRPFWLRLPWWLYLVFVLILGILALRLWHTLRP